MYARTGCSMSIFPSSASISTAIAPKVFEVDPTWKSVSVVTGKGRSTCVTPNPSAYH